MTHVRLSCSRGGDKSRLHPGAHPRYDFLHDDAVANASKKLERQRAPELTPLMLSLFFFFFSSERMHGPTLTEG